MNFSKPLKLAIVCVAGAFLPALAQPGALAGGGFHFQRVDNTSQRQERVAPRAVLGAQLVGENLGMLLQGGYAQVGSRGTPGGDSASRHETRLFELHLLPKFYLRTGDVAAYFIGGGGPQWTLRETRLEGAATARSTRLDAGFQAGFGVEAAISETWAVGVWPSYHVVYWNGRREFGYTTFTVYLKL